VERSCAYESVLGSAVTFWSHARRRDQSSHPLRGLSPELGLEGSNEALVSEWGQLWSAFLVIPRPCWAVDPPSSGALVRAFRTREVG
jgi:hypothetical protein